MTNVLTGVILDGRVELDSPAALPNGTRVHVEPAPARDGFILDEDWPTTPEGIAELVRHMEQFDPVVLTPDDETRIAAARAATREVTLAAVRKQMGIDP
jgi:hypothetical protein